MRRLLFLAISAIVGFAMHAQSGFSPILANYQLHWQWGLIDMQAGYATVKVDMNDGMLNGTLSGQSIVWEGRVYCVNDTLQAQVSDNAIDISYVNGWYRKPRTDSHVDVNAPRNYATILGQGELSASPSTIEAVTITAYLINLYYYAKAINFDEMGTGDTKTIAISNPDGIADTLQIVYNGTADGKDYGVEGPVYVTICNFTYRGEPSNYPVTVAISQDTHLPMVFSSDIKIGHVEMKICE